MKFTVIASHGPDMMRFLFEQTGLDLRGQNLDGPNWFCVTVHDITGRIAAACACEFKSPFDVHFSAAIDDPAAISRKLLAGIFEALFTKAARITALVDPDNPHAESCAKRLGFIYEGFLRRGLDGERDALVYGMLREDCRYLSVRAAHANGGLTDGQSAQIARPLRNGSGSAAVERGVSGGQRHH